MLCVAGQLSELRPYPGNHVPWQAARLRYQLLQAHLSRVLRPGKCRRYQLLYLFALIETI